MEDIFKEFIGNLQIDNLDDKYFFGWIAKKLNQKYYDNSTADNYLIVVSMRRSTSIKEESDMDVIYELIKSVFKYLSVQDEDRKQWNVMGSNQIIDNKNYNFIKKARKFIINFQMAQMNYQP